MPQCINKNNLEYQLLQNRANISKPLLDAVCQLFLQKYNRFPHLDELPNSDSESYIRKALSISKNNGVEIQKVLDYTKSSTIEEAMSKLNNDFRDKEIHLLPIVDNALITITPRPSVTSLQINEIFTPDENVQSAPIIIASLEKLASMYGIQIHQVTDRELNSDKWADLMPQDRFVNAFIWNGEIYLNTDRATVDSKVHELLHLFVGSMRFMNPELYKSLIDQVENFPKYSQLASEYPNRTQNDLHEELFVQELAKYLTGVPSEFDIIPSNILYEIKYNVSRTLDSMLMGDISARTLSDDILYNSSFKEIVDYTNSPIMTNRTDNNPSLHRKLNNLKSDLIKTGQLEEICD